jgi:hypothetical protein
MNTKACSTGPAVSGKVANRTPSSPKLVDVPTFEGALAAVPDGTQLDRGRFHYAHGNLLGYSVGRKRRVRREKCGGLPGEGLVKLEQGTVPGVGDT